MAERVDPTLNVPGVVQDYEIGTGGSGSFLDDDSESGGSAPFLYSPDFTVESMTERKVGAYSVVDIVLDINEVAGAERYEVRAVVA